MTNLFENLPNSLNREFRGYLVNNFKTLNQDRLTMLKIIEAHKNQKSNAHTTKQIDHKGKPLDETVDVLTSRIANQIFGASANSSSEVKDIRVGNDGTIYDLAQDRLMNDFSQVNSIANKADSMTQEHEEKISESAYYNEIEYISGRKFGTSYKIVMIPQKDSNGNMIKIKKGISGSDPNNPDVITARDFAKQTGATFVANGSTGSMSTGRLHGQQIFNGQVLDSIKASEFSSLKNRWTLAIADDNTMAAFPQNVTASEIRAKGYNNTWSGFGPLVMEGKKVYSKGDYSSNSEEFHPRTVVAQLPNKDTIIFTCDGRVEAQGLYQKGMTLSEVIETLYTHYGDIQFAFNLDGGGSTSSVLRSKMLNKPTDNKNKSERSVLDFIYIGKDPKQVRDIDMQRAYEDIGEVRSFTQFIYGLIQYWNEISSNEIRLKQYDDYTGLVAMQEDIPKKKFYMQPNEFRFWDYDTDRTWFRVTENSMQLHNRELARKFSAPETAKDCNNIMTGGDYLVPKTAKGSPYPGESSAIVTQYNANYSSLEDATTAFQTAVPFARSENYKMKRRAYSDGKWSQWFNV